MMIDRALFTRGQGNPEVAVPLSETCTVPTERMALLLADLLDLRPDSFVLEIGTGSGYQTAILAQRAKGVVSIEIDPLPGVESLLPANVVLIHANGFSHDTGDKYDGVLVTFACASIEVAWFEQLKEGGRLVAPIKAGTSCRITVLRRVGEALEVVDVAGYARFVEGQQECRS